MERSLKQRRGHCSGCGKCCCTYFSCPFIEKTSGQVLCRIHEKKPSACQIYPFDEKDFFPHMRESCTFWFEPEPQA